MTKPAIKRTNQKTKIDVAGKMIHGESIQWTDDELQLDDPKIFRALNWYNYNHSRLDAKKFIIQYFELTGDAKTAKIAKKFCENKIMASVGWICHMISSGANIVDETGKFTNRVADMELRPEKYISNDTANDEKIDGRKTSPQDRMKKYAREYVSTIDAEIDNFIQNGCKETDDFDLKSFLGTIKNGYFNYILTTYESLRDELRGSISGGDKELKESYSFLSKPELKRYKKYIDTIFSEIDKIKKSRKKEKKKTKKPAKKKVLKNIVKPVKTKKSAK